MIDHSKAFILGNNILTKWGCTDEDKILILGLEPVAFQEYLDNPSSAVLSDDQLKRLSYLANIHQVLREVFSNPENIYGFMKMKNHNPIFNGRTPLSILKDGDLNSFTEAFQSISELKTRH